MISPDMHQPIRRSFWWPVTTHGDQLPRHLGVLVESADLAGSRPVAGKPGQIAIQINGWLVGQGHPSEKWWSSSIGMMTATQDSWENKIDGNQTTHPN